ncbi:hypothetical protein BH10PSE12_BH10PSE12_28240 [soil metagenome]
MSVTGILRKVLRHVPDALVPGAKPDNRLGQHGRVGAPLSRLDGPLKVRGEARFAAEVAMEGLLHAALVHSTIARGRIAGLDTKAAEAASGVALVMTYRNAPRLKPPEAFGEGDGVAGSNLPILQDDSIHWNGETVAVVLAETQEQADHAAGLVVVSYAPEVAVTDFAAARAKARDPGSIMGEPSVLKIGDAEEALAAAAHKVDHSYTTPPLNHNAIELHVATVHWQVDDQGEGEVVVHDASQMITSTAAALAKVFGLKPEQVHVLSPFVGGGFGGKGLWSHQVLAITASKLAKRPVRLVLSRESVYRLVGGRTPTVQRVALGANGEGKLEALIHGGTVAMTKHNNVPEQFTFPARHLYQAGSFLLEQQVADLDMLANTFMRAPGESVGTFALECAVDELAHEMAIDPIELRRRWEPERDPTSGSAFSSRHLPKAYEDGVARFGWDKRDAVPGPQGGAGRRDGELLIGMGVATATYPYYRMPGARARLRMAAGGGSDGGCHVMVSTAGHEMGMGTATVQAQHAADRLGLKLEDVSFEYGDSRLPAGAMAGGSSQTAGTLAAVTAAAAALVAELLKLAGNDSPLAGLKAGDVVARDLGAEGGWPGPRQGSLEARELCLDPGTREAGLRRGRGSRAAAARDDEILHAFDRRAVRRGRRQCGDRRGAGATLPGIVRLRAHPQPQDGDQPVPRRHHHGHRPGAHRGDAVRSAQRPGDESQPGRVSRAGASRCARDRCDLDRHSRSAQPAGRPRHRRDRHHRRGGGDRQRGVQRHGQAGARPADHAGQATAGLNDTAARTFSRNAERRP